MRKSCIVQLVIFVVILVVLAMSIRRYTSGDEASQPSAAAVATAAPTAALPAAPANPFGAFGAKLLGQSQPAQESQMAAAPVPTLPNSGIEGLALRLSQPLMLKATRVQGLAANDRFLYAATYDPALRRATLYQLHRASGTVAQVRNIQQSGQFVLGGIHVGSLLWAPLANGDGYYSTTILGIDPQSLEVKLKFEVPDRIVAVAQGGNSHLYGVNEGSVLFYEWSADGQLLRQVVNASGASYQDMEVILGSLVCAGLDRNGGVLDIVDPDSLSLLARHRCHARLNDQSFVTHKGFAYADEMFYFLPEEGDLPMMLTYVLDGQTLDRYVPSVHTTP